MTAPLAVDDVLGGIVSGGVESLKKNLGKAWDALTPDERASAAKLLAALGKARLEEIAGRDVSDYLPVLEAGFLQWQALGEGEVANALKAVGRDILGMAGAFVGSALTRLVRV